MIYEKGKSVWSLTIFPYAIINLSIQQSINKSPYLSVYLTIQYTISIRHIDHELSMYLEMGATM